MTQPPHPYGPPPAWPPHAYPALGSPDPAAAQQGQPSPYAWPQPVQPYPYPPQSPQLGQQSAEPMPDNGLVLAIVACLSGCVGGFIALIPGIVAVVKANSVARLWQAGQLDQAKEAARAAKTWSFVAFGVSLLGCCGSLGLLALSAAASHG